jgi:hypothetical protein
MRITARQHVRVLFFAWNWALARFVDVVTELAEGGHEVVIASPSDRAKKLPKSLRRAGIELVVYDEVSDPAYGRAIALLRDARSYAWYLAPAHRLASFNRQGSLKYLVESATGGARETDRSWPDPLVPLTGEEQALMEAALTELEGRIPPDPQIVELIRAQRPDVVLVSPLVEQRCHQTEVVKAARALGVPTGFLPRSWDNLSNKGRIHVAPDRTFVWNETQRQEAIELHGLDAESVVVTGAPHWDRFFELKPSSTREEFCSRHGFDPSSPIVLFLGSSHTICADEASVLSGWIEAVRAEPTLRTVNILYRPHPDRPDPAIPPGSAEKISISPSPKEADQGLYDDLHHAAAAVGLNTTAQIEASILGTPVYTFSAGDLAPGQEGTLHFYYLLKREIVLGALEQGGHGGLVAHGDSIEEHVAQLARGVAGDYDRDAIREFCKSFMRPHGLDEAVSPLVAREVLALAGATVAGS